MGHGRRAGGRGSQRLARLSAALPRAAKWPTKLPMRALALAFILSLFGITSVAAQPSGPRLTWRWSVGDRLVYERRAQVVRLSDGREIERFAEQIQVWVLKREEPRHQLLLEASRIEDGAALPPRALLVEVEPRGQTQVSDECLRDALELDYLLDLLPTLPPALGDNDHWATEPDFVGRRWRCRRGELDAGRGVAIDVELDDASGASECLGQSARGRTWFDPRLGAVSRVEIERRDATRDLLTLSVIQYHDTLPQDERWRLAATEQLERWLSAERLEQRALLDLWRQPRNVDSALARLQRRWEEYLTGFPRGSRSPYESLGRTRLLAVPERSAGWKERARLAEAWINRRSPDWRLPTPEGEMLTSAELRSTACIEFFWSVKSEGSLRSFEALRRAQAEFSAQPINDPGASQPAAMAPKVRIVCINLDNDVEAASQAARTVGAGLTHVLAGARAGEIPAAHLPVWRVVDPAGEIRRVDFGWRARATDLVP